MSSLGRITNSLVSATNENTLALANFNFDFSLIKFDAPKEFSALGLALSPYRRDNAEDGSSHQTARRLGALFEQIVPSTPKLMSVYGLRASEIMQTSGVNPRGSSKEGAFAAFVGADGTSLWAAATSGTAAIGVHLLSCMLARQLGDVKASIAIWVEMVHERQKEIVTMYDSGQPVDAASLMAARQTISRDDLARLDASARSWIRSADEAKASQQTKLMLILKNLTIPVATGVSTYSNVIHAWKQAMSGLEKLLSGLPQQVWDGTILLALSAWHLYPDLIVLGSKTVNVQLRDPLLTNCGLVTVGLQSTDKEFEKGIEWSLTLSHYRYYGDPIKINSYADDSRVTIAQLRLVALGALLASWHVEPKDSLKAASWFHELWLYLSEGDPTNSTALSQQMSWLYVLVSASTYLLETQKTDKENSDLLVNYGHRRGQCFLGYSGKTEERNLRFFGLANSLFLDAMAQECEIECGLQYMRESAKSLGLDGRDAVIIYSEYHGGKHLTVVATAVPHQRVSSKRSQDGVRKIEYRHARWIELDRRFTHPWDTNQRAHCQCRRECLDTCPCIIARFYCGLSCHRSSKKNCQAAGPECRRRDYYSRNEHAEILTGYTSRFEKLSNELLWRSPPRLFSAHCSPNHDTSTCNCLDANDSAYTGGERYASFREVIGTNSGFNLYINNISDHSIATRAQRDIKLGADRVDLDAARERLASKVPQKAHILQYLRRLGDNETSYRFTGVVGGGPSVLTTIHGLFPEPVFLRSLQTLALCSLIYNPLAGATLSLKVVSRPPYEALWVPTHPHLVSSIDKDEAGAKSDPSIYEMSRSQVFSCLALFETGVLNISPSNLEGVMAMSSDNSIFAAGVLLSDPADKAVNTDVRRIVGNVGRAGVTFMVAPTQLRIRPAALGYRAVAHEPYDYERDDKFGGTSLHLWFTESRLPLAGELLGTIDRDAFIVETVISVRDQGIWVADIDILAARDKDYTVPTDCQCEQPVKAFSDSCQSIDTWDEILDLPLAQGIVRAKGNWAGRLAALCVLRQAGQESKVGVVGPGNLCLKCLESKGPKNDNGSIYID